METSAAVVARTVSAIRMIATAAATAHSATRTTAAAGSAWARRREIPSAILLGRTRTKGRAAAAAIPAAAKNECRNIYPRRAGGRLLPHFASRVYFRKPFFVR